MTAQDAAAAGGSDNLALLYQGLLTSIVRVRAGTQPITDANEFRRRTREVLAGVEREALRLGYSTEDIRGANYAVVAFLDESVLTSNDPNQATWSALQSELYDQAVAGESFFDQLERLRRRHDSPEMADLLEVYYLCLLLGYRGRYAGYAADRQADLARVMAELRARIEGVRGAELVLWPGQSPAIPRSAPVSDEDAGAARLKTFAIAAAALLVAGWTVCLLLLIWQATQIQSNLAV